MPARHEARALLGLIAASLALALLLDPLLGRFLDWNPVSVRDSIRRAGALAPVVYVGIVALAIVIPPLPSIPLDVAGGLAFGLWWGITLTLVGDLLGAAIAFSIARRLARPRLHRVAGGAALEALVAGLTPRRLVGIRLLPTFSFEVVSYAAGLSRMSLPAFLVATLVGVAGPASLLVALGDALLGHPRLVLGVFGLLLAITVVPLVWWGWGPHARCPEGDPDH